MMGDNILSELYIHYSVFYIIQIVILFDYFMTWVNNYWFIDCLTSIIL